MEHSEYTFEALLGQREWVRALARTLVRDQADGDDLEQQVWLAALRAKPPRSPRAWLGAVLRNTAARMHRTRSRQERRERAAATPETTRATADVVAEAETHRRVVEAVLELDEPYRTTVLLRYFEDLKPREVARRMDAPTATVRSRLRRAAERLRGRLASVPLAALAALAARPAAAALTTGALIVSTKTKLALVGLVLAAGLLFLVPVVFLEREDGAKTAQRDVPASAVPDTTVPEDEEPTSEPPPPTKGCPVRVVGAGQEGIAGAEVAAVKRDGTVFRAKTDATGLAVLPESSAGPATYWASAPKHALVRGEFVLGEQEARIVLSAGGSVRIRWVGGGVAPAPKSAHLVPEAATRLWYLAQNRELAVALALWMHETDLSQTVDAGSWQAIVERPGSTPFLTAPFLVREGETTMVDVPLSASPKVRRIRVVSDTSGEPLRGARVRPYLAYGTAVGAVPGPVRTTDANGEIDVPLEKPGGFLYASWWVEGDGRGGWFNLFASRKSKQRVFEVRLLRTWTLGGKAYLSTGEPASNLRLFGLDGGRVVETRTGQDGSFVLQGVWRGRGSQLKVLLVLVESWSPLRTVRTQLSGGWFRFTKAGKRVEELRRELTKTARARLANPDDATLAARRRKLFEELSTARGQMLKAEPPERLPVVVGLPASEGTGSLEGRVTFGGEPLAGAEIHVETDDWRYATALTDETGRYRMARVPAGQINVFVHWSNPYRFGSPFLIRGDGLLIERGITRRLDFDLPGGEFVVTVVDATTGRPVPGAVVHGSPTNIEVARERFEGLYFLAGWTTTSDKSGRVRLPGMVEGKPHRVTATAPGYETAQEKDVVPGTRDAPMQLTVRLRPAPR